MSLASCHNKDWYYPPECITYLKPLYIPWVLTTCMILYYVSWILFMQKYSEFALTVPAVMLKLGDHVAKRRKRIIVIEVLAFIALAVLSGYQYYNFNDFDLASEDAERFSLISYACLGLTLSLMAILSLRFAKFR